MRIGFITDCIRNDSSGIGIYAKGLIEAILKYRSDVKYVFIDYKKTSFNKNHLYLIKYPLKFGKISIFHSYLPLAIRNLQLDYIFNFYMMPHFFLYKQKEIFFVHDITFKLFPQFHTWQMVLLTKILMRKTIKNAYKIIVNSETTKKDLMKFYFVPEEKIFKIFIPIIENKYKNTRLVINKIPKPYILNVNTIEPRKNIINLIKAFEILKKTKKIPHFLVIVGKKGWKFNKIFEVINNSEFKNEIKLCGYVSEEEKWNLYKYATVLVYPSFYEGFGIPILEAMSYGCPVITSNTSSMKEVAGKAALFINPTSYLDISKTIERVIFNERLRKEMILKGLIQAKKYTDETYIKTKIKQLFNFLES